MLTPNGSGDGAGVYAVNNKLRDVTLIGLGRIESPEDVILDRDDNLYAGSRHGDVIRFLAPDVALIHQTWSMAGDKNPDGTPRPPRDGIFTQVFVKRDGKWLITASQNTNIIVIPGSAVAGSMPAK